MYLPHSYVYLGHAVGRDDYCDELRKYIHSELHKIKEEIKSVQKTMDSFVQASRNPASSNKGPMLADYSSCGEISMEDDLGSIFSSLCSTTASPAANVLSSTEEEFTQENSAPPTTTVGASLYPTGPTLDNYPYVFIHPPLFQGQELSTVPQTMEARCDTSALRQPLTSQHSPEQISLFSSVSLEDFMSADAVLAKYQRFKNRCDASRLAIQLAKRTYFGTSVMSHSTVSGRNNTTPLDRKKMKAVLRGVFSSISEEELERVWMNCCTLISHACKNLRN